VIESKSAAILVEFTGGKAKKATEPRELKIFWIDDYTDLHMNAPAAGQPSK
jgi:hypothetical protein